MDLLYAKVLRDSIETAPFNSGTSFCCEKSSEQKIAYHGTRHSSENYLSPRNHATHANISAGTYAVYHDKIVEIRVSISFRFEQDTNTYPIVIS